MATEKYICKKCEKVIHIEKRNEEVIHIEKRKKNTVCPYCGSLARYIYTPTVCRDTLVTSPPHYLEKLIIPEGIKIIESFIESSIKEISFPSTLKTIPPFCFFNCRNLKKLVMGDNITVIGFGVFCGCKDLENIVLSKSLTTIGESAFGYCESLKTVIIPEGVEKIYRLAFCGCKNLETIILPQSLKVIGKYAFKDCESLKTVIIPEGVEEIGEWAFSDCKALENIVLPKSLTTIDESAFKYCESLKTIIVPEGVKEISKEVFSHYKNLETVILPKSLKIIGESAFEYCESLKTVIIPEGVEEIGESAFYGCMNLYFISLPKSLKKIGDYAFWRCELLENVILPKNLQTISSSSFNYESQLSVCKDSKTDEELVDASNKTYYTGNKKCAAFSCNDKKSHACVVDGILYYQEAKQKNLYIKEGITIISESVFCGNSNIERVYFPKSLTRIEENAFANCHNLKEIYFEDGISFIGKGTFSSKTEGKIQSVSFPNSLKTIENNAFAGQPILELSFGKGIKHIGENAFKSFRGYYVELPKNTVFFEDSFGKRKDVIISFGNKMALTQKQKNFRTLLEEKQEQLGEKHRALSEAKLKAESLFSQIADLKSNVPNGFSDIPTLETEIQYVIDVWNKKSLSINQEKDDITKSISELRKEIDSLKHALNETFFLSFSKKKILKEQIEEKTNLLSSLLQKLKDLEEEEQAAYSLYVSEYQKKNSLLQSLKHRKNNYFSDIKDTEELYSNTEFLCTALKEEISLLEKDISTGKDTVEKEEKLWRSKKEEAQKKNKNLYYNILSKTFIQCIKNITISKINSISDEKSRMIKSLSLPQSNVISIPATDTKAFELEIEICNSLVDSIITLNKYERNILYRKYLFEKSNIISKINNLNVALNLNEWDGIKTFDQSLYDTTKPSLAKAPLKFTKLNKIFLNEDWELFKTVFTVFDNCEKHKNDIYYKFFSALKGLCFEDKKENLFFLFPSCVVAKISGQNKQPKIQILLYSNVTVEATFYEEEFSGYTPEQGEVVSQRYKHVNKDGSPSKKYSDNPIIYTVRFSYLEATLSNKIIVLSAKSHLEALKMEDDFNKFLNSFKEGIRKNIQRYITSDISIEEIEKEISDFDSKEAKRLELERKKSEKEKLRKEKEEQKAKEEQQRINKEIIERQIRLNEERKQKEAEKKKAFETFREDFFEDHTSTKVPKVLFPEEDFFIEEVLSKNDDDIKNKENTDMVKEEYHPEGFDYSTYAKAIFDFEITSKRIITNTVFKIKFNSTDDIQTDFTAYFIDCNNEIISNKKIISFKENKETSIGFILNSGIDFTLMKECILRIESPDTMEYMELPFEMNISFYSDF